MKRYAQDDLLERDMKLAHLIEGVKTLLHELWECGAEAKLITEYERHYGRWVAERNAIRERLALHLEAVAP